MIVNASIRVSMTDAEIAAKYELGIDAQYVPLDIYTRAVDYPDPIVQVSEKSQVGPRPKGVTRVLYDRRGNTFRAEEKT